MRRVTLTDNGRSRSFMISDQETPYQILEHYSITPETKLVYVNGNLVSNQKMNAPIQIQGTIFITVQDKTLIRD